MKTRTIEKIREQSRRADKKYRVNMKKDGGVTSHEVDRAIVSAFAGLLRDWTMANRGTPHFMMPAHLRQVIDEAIGDLNALSRQRMGKEGFLPDNRKRITEYLESKKLT